MPEPAATDSTMAGRLLGCALVAAPLAVWTVFFAWVHPRLDALAGCSAMIFGFWSHILCGGVLLACCGVSLLGFRRTRRRHFAAAGVLNASWLYFAAVFVGRAL